MIKEFLKKLIYKYAPPLKPPYKDNKFFEELNELERPKYLKAVYKAVVGKKLNLKKPKTFREKIQWIKLYDATPLKTKLTDKVLVRNWVKEKIGEEYLKPVLQVCDDFSQIDFSALPQSFIIKTNHGCKWHYKIKNKDAFLNNKIVYSHISDKFYYWLRDSFWYWGTFEMQYKDIQPKIIIEPLLIEDKNSKKTIEYEIFCFNGKPKFYQILNSTEPCETVVYNEDFSISNILFGRDFDKLQYEIDEQLKKTIELSSILCKEFNLVRVDWMRVNDKIYFNEMTFTPYSGFMNLNDKDDELLGNMLLL